MNISSRATVVCGLFVLIAATGFAQSKPLPQEGVSGPAESCTQWGRPVTGAPYSATEETELSQTLADGTHIARKWQSARVYRDSQGRMRREMYNLEGPPGSEESVLLNINITDVVDCVHYSINPQTHMASRIPPPPNTTRQAPQSAEKTTTTASEVRPASVPEDLRPKISNESLGTQTIEGVLANGSRMTTVFPAGSTGNDRAIVQVSETWTAADLRGIVVLRTMDDPRSGQRIMRLINIDRTEPDPALFRVPRDYTITTTVVTTQQP